MSNSVTRKTGQALPWRKLAARQQGLIEAGQASALGLDKHALHRKVRSGELQRVLPRVYRLTGSPRSWQQDVFAAYLWGRGEAVVCGRTAGKLLGLDGVESSLIELVAKKRMQPPAPNLVISQFSLEACDVSQLNGLTITTMPRTIIDLAGLCDEESVDFALDSAIRKGMPRERFKERPQRLSAPGSKGTALLNKLMSERQGEQALTDSTFERALLRWFRRASLPRPICQFEFRDVDGFVARLDFAYPELGVAIEADGYRWHDGRDAWERDRRRLSELASRGWRVIQITWIQLKYQPHEATIGSLGP